MTTDSPDTSPTTVTDRIGSLLTATRDRVRTVADSATEHLDDRRTAKTRDGLLIELGTIYARVLNEADDDADFARRDEIVAALAELDTAEPTAPDDSADQD